MKNKQKKRRRLGLLAGSIVLLLEKRPKKFDPKNADFSTSVQRMGVHFSERIRNFWRKKWISAEKQDK